MHTAVAPYRLNELVHAQEEAIGKGPVLWLRLMGLRWSAYLLRTFIKSHLHSSAQDYLGMALMFKGIHADLIANAGASDLAADVAVSSLIESLGSFEDSLMASRSQALGIASKLKSRRSDSLHVQLSELIAANADVFEVVQAVRWELMEQQADADIRGGRTQNFGNAEDAIAYLRQQA